MPAKGTTCLYRLPPADFDRLFVEHGWSEIEALTNAHAKTIRKWLDLRNADRLSRGLQALQDARTAYVSRHGKALPPKRIAEGQPRRSASRYVLGRTNRTTGWPSPAPRFWDFGLLPGVSAVQSQPRRVAPGLERAARILERWAAESPSDVRAALLDAAERMRSMRMEVR